MSEIYKAGLLKNDPKALSHFGILGMKWGVRRYQNKDGSLTAAGRKRYLNGDGSLTKKGKKELTGYARLRYEYEQRFNTIQKQYDNDKKSIKDIIKDSFLDDPNATKEEMDHSVNCYYWLTSLFDGRNGKSIYDNPEIANRLLAFGDEKYRKRNLETKNVIKTGKMIAEELGLDDHDFRLLYVLANDRS